MEQFSFKFLRHSAVTIPPTLSFLSDGQWTHQKKPRFDVFSHHHNRMSKNSISLMQRQFFITHTICQTDIPTLLDSWFTNTPSVKMLCPQMIDCPYIHTKTKHVSLLACWGLVEFFSLSFKFPGHNTQLIICVCHTIFVTHHAYCYLARCLMENEFKKDVEKVVVA